MAFPLTRAALAAVGLLAGTFSVVVPQALANEDAFKQDANDALKIIVDRARVVRIAKAADTIIVGNPAIVDATIQDARTLILTGRSFGVTNLIVLDAEGDPIVDETVVVQGHERNTVRIYRQALRETLACSPVCEPTLTIGDNEGPFDTAHEQIEKRNELSTKAAETN
ncbi:MAG: pilus assembly protein N-terminal domain-containing protein [Pseudomonadota bacterium]